MLALLRFSIRFEPTDRCRLAYFDRFSAYGSAADGWEILDNAHRSVTPVASFWFVINLVSRDPFGRPW